MRPLQDRHHEFDDLLNRRQPSWTVGPARHLADFRMDHVNAAIRQGLEIRLNRRVVPHSSVHRRRDDDRSGHCEVKRRQEIVGDACSQPRNAVGRSGRDEQQVDGLRDENVIERAFEVAAGARTFEDVDVDFVSGKRAKRQWSDELRCPFGHQDRDVDAAILQAPDDFRCLVARNSAADARERLSYRSILLASCFARCPVRRPGIRNFTSPCRISF